MSFQTTDEDSVETRLHDAGVRPTAVRPIEELAARARQLRRRRHAVRAGGLGAGVLAAGLACAVALSPTVRGDLLSGLDGAAQAAGVDLGLEESCTTDYGYSGDFSDVPDLLYLPAAAVAGAPALTFVRMDHSTCEPDPLALVAYQAGKDGVGGQAGLKIYGPGARNLHEFDPETGEPLDEPVGSVFEDPAAPGNLTQYLLETEVGHETPYEAYWTDPAGQGWFFETYGFESDALTDLVKGLHTRGGKIDPKSLPEALTSWRVAGGIDPDDWPAATLIDDRDLVQPARDHWWWAANYDPEDAGWVFEVTGNKNLIEQAATFPGATPLQLKVLGESREALWIEDMDRLSWQLPRGAVASVVGLPRDEAKRIAESLTEVKADDPVLVDSREKTPRNIPEN